MSRTLNEFLKFCDLFCQIERIMPTWSVYFEKWCLSFEFHYARRGKLGVLSPARDCVASCPVFRDEEDWNENFGDKNWYGSEHIWTSKLNFQVA